jgi:hypothetical protein
MVNHFLNPVGGLKEVSKAYRGGTRLLRRLVLIAVPAILVAQSSRLDRALATPAMTVPPVIMLVPSGGKMSAVLLATKDVPAGTGVLPVVTTG